jgi:predicted dehydrogenase
MKDKLRVGVIGVGSVVREIYQHLYFRSRYSPILEVAAIVDPDAATCDAFGDAWDIPPSRRFRHHREMLEAVELDAAQVNTPDHVHREPTLDALAAGLDVVVPKPTAATVSDAHAMIEAATRHGRLLGIDFHKREDPRIKEATARYQSGRYGPLQATVWYMLDKLFVADPNHEPRFFASADFAEKNTPISFLTVHMADALMAITKLKPLAVRATGFTQKLPSLRPIALKAWDMVDTEIRFEGGAVAHIITGWHLPNTVHATTVQSSRLICRDGMIDLQLDASGYREFHDDGIAEANSLFRNFQADGTVSGYGMDCPGRLYEAILALRNGRLADAERAALMSPTALGFYTTVVLQAAERSLEQGIPCGEGVVSGPSIAVPGLVRDEIGAAAADYGYGD